MFESYDDLVTIEMLCEMLSVGKNVAYDLLNKNKIKAFKIGRVWKIPKKAVEVYIFECSKLKL